MVGLWRRFSSRTWRLSCAAGLVSDVEENVLKAGFAQRLISRSERDLNDASELCEFLGNTVLNVGDALKVGCELLTAPPAALLIPAEPVPAWPFPD